MTTAPLLLGDNPFLEQAREGFDEAHGSLVEAVLASVHERMQAPDRTIVHTIYETAAEEAAMATLRGDIHRARAVLVLLERLMTAEIMLREAEQHDYEMRIAADWRNA